MKNKLFSRVVGLLLALVLLIPPGLVEANAATKNIKDYVSVDGGIVDNVLLPLSYNDFISQIEMGATPFLIPEGKYEQDFSISFSENGYLLFRGTGNNSYSAGIYMYRDISKTTQVAYNSCKNYTTAYGYIPVEAGTYYFTLYYLNSFYIGFVPASSICEISGREQKNKSVYVDIKSLEKKTKITAVGLDGTKSAASCWLDWLNGDYSCSVKDNVATILLPEAGKYTIMVETEYNEDCHNRLVYHIDTDKLLQKDKTIKTPISILAGTNVIVGEAVPGSTVYATYGGVDYSVKVDSSGVYRLKVGKLKKKKSVKMWQVENGKTTAEATFKVVNKY